MGALEMARGLCLEAKEATSVRGSRPTSLPGYSRSSTTPNGDDLRPFDDVVVRHDGARLCR